MSAQAPRMDGPERDTVRSLLRELWRDRLQPSRPGSGRETRTGRVMHALLFITATLTAFVTIGIVLVLIFETIEFFREVPFLDFFGSTKWSALFAEKQFGVWALVWGTGMIALVALIVAIPLGLMAAVFLSEYAPPRLRAVVKPMLEVLAGVPTVVFGYFALASVSPVIRSIFGEDVGIYNALSAGIVVGLMIVPIIASLSEDAMNAVPRALREGAYALGATRMEVSLRVVVPAAFSGVVASVILAASRAVGETMAVTIAGGGNPQFGVDPLEAVQTMTAMIVQLSLGDTPTTSIEFKVLFAVAMTLFVLTLGMNIIAQWISRRFREEYE